MKIEKIESILSGNSHFVRIITDNGLEGIGQSACWGYMEATHSIISNFEDYRRNYPERFEWKHFNTKFKLPKST